MSAFSERSVRKAEISGTEPHGDNFAETVTQVAGRFRIGKRLGAGGMGEVYEAEDTLLQRRVALKRVAPKLRNDPDYRRRLIREARRASALNHPNIAQIYDVVEEHGEAFLVMECVAGISLRDHTKCPADMKEFLRIAPQCAEALSAAHQQGILHGDIKPENIMLTPAGNVKVLDFGVAKRLPQPGLSQVAESVETTAPTFEGTPAYMAPEVLKGQQADGRADIFSLGVVFYEMLSGNNPFKAETLATTVERVLNRQPEPLRLLNSQAIPSLNEIVQKMLAKDPTQRYGSASELLEALGDINVDGTSGSGRQLRLGRAALVVLGTAALGIAVLFALGGGNLLRSIRDWFVRPAVPALKQLAVLPVWVEGSDRETAAFASGLMDMVTGRLGQLTEQRSLDVIPASEIVAKGVSTVDQARQEFGVNLVLTVAIHRSGNMLRISPVLLDARTHRELRARVVTDAVTSPFALEDRVADMVVEELGLEVGPQEQKILQEHGTKESAAYDLYLQGRGYLRESEKPENIDKAIGAFRAATEKDPRFGLAYAGLGEAYWAKYEHLKDAKWILQATEMCNHAVNAGNAGAEGNICLGMLSNGQGEYAQAANYYQRALDIDKGNDWAYVGLAKSYEGLGKLKEAEQALRQMLEFPGSLRGAYNQLGVFCSRQGRYADAVEMFKKYVDLAPDAFVGYYNLGAMYVNLGQYAEAIQDFNRSISIRPTADAYTNLGTAYFDLGQYDRAIPAFEQAVKLDGHRYDYWGNLGDSYYWTPGRQAEAPEAYRKAIALAEDAIKVNPRDAEATVYIAQYHAMLGDRALALQYLQQALALAPKSSEIKFNAAVIYSQLGESDKAISALKEALAAGYPVGQIDVTPNFSKLRTDPRFEQLSRKQKTKGKADEQEK